eukprot:9036537-Alexandrium_andersonii.AAC.1
MANSGWALMLCAEGWSSGLDCSSGFKLQLWTAKLRPWIAELRLWVAALWIAELRPFTKVQPQLQATELGHQLGAETTTEPWWPWAGA